MTTTEGTREKHRKPRKKQALKDLVAANFGNSLEWFDWNIYTIFAPYFAAQFFHAADSTAELLSTLAVFAVGFIARPFGGLVFGAYADRVGRKQALFVAMMLTALGSLVIGLSPTYSAIGIAASFILVAARLLQGLAHGGEMGTSVTYLVERAPRGRRALFGASSWVSVVIGTMLATICGLIITGLLNEDQLHAYGWRIPFIIGGLLGLYAVYLRRNLTETDAFSQNAAPHDPGEISASTTKSDDAQQPTGPVRGIITIFGISAGGSLMFYTWLIYLPTHAQVNYGQSHASALTASLIAQAVFLFAILGMGVLGDRIGRKPLVIGFSVAFIVLTIPLYNLLDGSFATLLIAMTTALIALSALFGVNGAVWSESLATRYRATGVAATLSAATALFGGTAPYLNTWLTERGHELGFQGYLITVAAITLATGIYMRETKNVNINA